MLIEKVTVQNAFEEIPGKFITEASILRLSPGLWPFMLETSIGDSENFIKDCNAQISPEEAVPYTQHSTGIQLVVLND